MNSLLIDVAVAAGLLLGLVVALEVGFRFGRRAPDEGDARSASQVGAIQGATLGLLGLLLAFSFAAAASRFLERQDLIVAEANAIGTAWLRAGLLDEPHQSQLRSELQDYTEHRIRISNDLRGGVDPDVFDQVQQFHDRIWSAAIAGAKAQPAFAIVVLPPVNDVIDLHSTRVAAAKKHLPLLIVGLLIACSILAIGVIGYGCGISGRRRMPLTDSLAIMICVALWITIDLDHPRAGLMQLDDTPLEALKFEMPRK